jgi:hypothetical protein
MLKARDDLLPSTRVWPHCITCGSKFSGLTMVSKERGWTSVSRRNPLYCSEWCARLTGNAYRCLSFFDREQRRGRLAITRH